MQLRNAFLIAVIALGGCAPRHANVAQARWTDGQAKAFFNDKGCNACHATDELRIGPAYRSVAQLYAAQPDEAVERLSLKIRHGGAGAWGSMPMVSNPSLTDAEARSAARWVLSLAARPPAPPASRRGGE
jgi:cytochrome c